MKFRMEKDEIAKLIIKKSDSITFKTHKDKSEAWKSFVKLLVDGEVCDFVKNTGCSSVLKYISGHGTGSMLDHSQLAEKWRKVVHEPSRSGNAKHSHGWRRV